ncbi:MAG: hypothetical protein ACPL7D_12720, partial [Candidatus Sumerlaeaceae bacterium]
LVKVERGVDPDAQQTTAPRETPIYDYRVYIPEGPVDPERPARPIFIAELIRRGLTPPPAESVGKPGAASEVTVSARPTESPAGPREQVVATVAPSPSPLVVPTATLAAPVVVQATPTPVPTVLATPVVVTPLPTRMASPPLSPAPMTEATAQPTPAEVRMSAAPTPVGSVLDALLAPAIKAVPTASSASYVGGASSSAASMPASQSLSAPASPSQQSLLGSVMDVRGTAQLKRGGTVQTLARGVGVMVGDTIQTGRDSVVVVRCADGVGVVVGGESEITLAKSAPASGAEIGVIQGFVWCAAEAGTAKPLSLAAIGCVLSPDLADAREGYALKMGVVPSGKVVVATMRGRALLNDTVLDAVMSVDAQRAAYYLPGSRKIEDHGELLPSLQAELDTVRTLLGAGGK